MVSPITAVLSVTYQIQEVDLKAPWLPAVKLEWVFINVISHATALPCRISLRRALHRLVFRLT